VDRQTAIRKRKDDYRKPDRKTNGKKREERRKKGSGGKLREWGTEKGELQWVPNDAKKRG